MAFSLVRIFSDNGQTLYWNQSALSGAGDWTSVSADATSYANLYATLPAGEAQRDLLARTSTVKARDNIAAVDHALPLIP